MTDGAAAPVMTALGARLVAAAPARPGQDEEAWRPPVPDQSPQQPFDLRRAQAHASPRRARKAVRLLRDGGGGPTLLACAWVLTRKAWASRQSVTWRCQPA